MRMHNGYRRLAWEDASLIYLDLYKHQGGAAMNYLDLYKHQGGAAINYWVDWKVPGIF